MKKFFLYSLTWIFGLSIANAQIQTASLQASGLTCALCAKSIYTNLTSLSFVESVDTDLNASAFELKFKSGADVDPEALRKKVEDAGFSVSKLILRFKADKQKIENNGFLKIGKFTYHFVQIKDAVYNGEVNIHIIDKEYLTAKDYKKKITGVKLACYQTPQQEDCQLPNAQVASTRVFHATIL
jgi:copper chaperone CopZ